MPFKSKKQQRYLYANHPEIAKRWAEHTPDIKSLPESVGEEKTALAKYKYSPTLDPLIAKIRGEIIDQRPKTRHTDPGFHEQLMARDPEMAGKIPDLDREAFVRALMLSGAPKGSLDATAHRLGSIDTAGDYARSYENKRITPLTAWRYQAGNFSDAALDREIRDGDYGKDAKKNWNKIRQGSAEIMGPHYDPIADVVVQPWNAPAASIHEYGHAIDFNARPAPKNPVLRGLNALGRDMYTLAPGLTLLKEHQAWRKGRNAFVDGAVQHDLPAEHVKPILADIAHAKYPALGSYWGSAIGGGLGAIAGIIGGYALNRSHGGLQAGNVGFNRLEPYLGGVLGGTLGGFAGNMLGTSIGGHFSGSAAKRQEDWADNEYPKLLAAKKPAAVSGGSPMAKVAEVMSAFELGRQMGKEAGWFDAKHDPALTNAVGFGALGALGGGLLGGIEGENAVDEQGRPRPRVLSGALSGALSLGGLGALGGYAVTEAARMAPHKAYDAYMAKQPEFIQWMNGSTWDKVPRAQQFQIGSDNSPQIAAIVNNPINRMAGHGISYLQGLMR